MLFHASFTARNPKKVAHVLAEITGATAIRAPSPPFPEDSWFACYGDEHGSLLEVLPWGTTLDQNAPRGVGYDVDMRPRSGAHVLVKTERSVGDVQVIAQREGWHAEVIDARLFKVLKVWIENSVLVEFLTPDTAGLYRSTFGSDGIAALDGKLRALEAALRAR
ncbi:MAG: hypothetical protein AB7F76_07040 [Parvibaculaceae bacterium]